MGRDGFCLGGHAEDRDASHAEGLAFLYGWSEEARQYRRLVDHIQDMAMKIDGYATTDVFDRRIEGFLDLDDRKGMRDDVVLLKAAAKHLDGAFHSLKRLGGSIG